MTALRPIETASYAKLVPSTKLGELPQLEWIPIAHLGIDDGYQREIQNLGRGNVRRIVVNFDWSKFAPVIVAKVGINQFAIVDGQHRTTAAALCGIERVPCAIIRADQRGQAAAFRAINAAVTKLTSLQLFHAAIAAGEIDACCVAEICKAAEVSILKYPKAYDIIAPGETMAPTVISRALKKFGTAPITATLLALRATPGALNGIIIYGLAEVLADHREWIEPRLPAAFEIIDVLEMREEACARSARIRGSSATDQFEALIVGALGRYFTAPKKAVTR